MSNKRQAEDADAGKNKKSKLTEPVGPRWPALPVDNHRWDTKLDKEEIYKTLALAQYRLKESHLKELSYEVKKHVNGKGYMHMYKEKDVQWVAWRVHGGPVGLWHLLRRLREDYDPGESKEPFPVPWEYTQGQRYNLDLTHPPICDRYLMGHSVMAAAKAELPSWFWIECNLAINRALDKGELPSGKPGTASKERVKAVRTAHEFFRRHRKRYADRPLNPVTPKGQKSLALPTFRALLSNAPSVSANLRDTDAWSRPRDRLHFHAGNYEWDDAYLRKVYKQIGALIKERGLEDNGWKSLRWEVYHKYARSVDGGLRYDARNRFWTDPAAVWLEGQIVPEPAPESMRGRCAEGLAYNLLLPVLSADARTPSPGPAFAFSNTPSPVRAPIAGPSSA